jgi:hypothetical protein
VGVLVSVGVSVGVSVWAKSGSGPAERQAHNTTHFRNFISAKPTRRERAC